MSPLYLPYVSPMSPLYLPYVSPVSPLCLPYVSPISAEVAARDASRASAEQQAALARRYREM